MCCGPGSSWLRRCGTQDRYLATGPRFGWWPSRNDSSHCGSLGVSSQAKDMEGKEESWLESWGPSISKGPARQKSHIEHVPGDLSGLETKHEAYPRCLLLKGRRQTVAETWTLGQSALECGFWGKLSSLKSERHLSPQVSYQKPYAAIKISLFILVSNLRFDIAQVIAPLGALVSSFFMVVILSIWIPFKAFHRWYFIACRPPWPYLDMIFSVIIGSLPLK